MSVSHYVGLHTLWFCAHFSGLYVYQAAMFTL